MKYNAIIVDNEPNSRAMLKLLVEELFPSVTLLAESYGVEHACEILPELQPDLLFLDVEMDDGSGFDVLKQLDTPPKITIFVTSYNKYAIKALRASAFDFILKPINREDFVIAVSRALQKLETLTANERTRNASNLSPGIPYKIAIPDIHGIKFVDTEIISRCEAGGNYTIVHFLNGMKETVSKPLGQFETDLVHRGFFRVHHKNLINLKHITSYQKGKAGGTVVMQDGSKVEVSVRKKTELLQQFALKG